jgi:hypothetical protein
MANTIPRWIGKVMWCGDDKVNRSINLEIGLVFEVGGVGDGAILYSGTYFFQGVWHINLTGRTWRMEWNTYIGVLN